MDESWRGNSLLGIEWLGGIWAAEGSFSARPARKGFALQCSIGSTDLDVIEYIHHNILDTDVSIVSYDANDGVHKTAYYQRTNSDEAENLMLKLLPYMQERQRMKIASVFDMCNKKLTRKQLSTKAPLGSEYVAGYLEGDGSFTLNKKGLPVVSACSIDEDLVDIVNEAIGYRLNVYGPYTVKNARPQLQLRGAGRDAVSIMEEIRPYMFSRRLDALDTCLSAWSPSRREPINNDKSKEAVRMVKNGLTRLEVANLLDLSHSSIKRATTGVKRWES